MNSSLKALRRMRQKEQLRSRLLLLILFMILVLLALTFLCFGERNYSIKTVLAVLTGESIQGASFTIGTLRLPRLWIGVLSGIALGVAGTTFQRLLHNPLASPDIIGVTSGSSVAAMFCILMLQMSGPIVSILSVLCGLLISAIIFFCSRGQGFSKSRMILVGLGMQAMLNAIISYLLLKANQQDVAGAFRWLSGSLTGMQMKQVPILLFVVLLCTGSLGYLERSLKIMELGEETAISLGVNHRRISALCLFCSVCLIAFSTSICGPIAFISFLAGPIAKQLGGSQGYRTLLAGMVGAILVLLADFIGQFAFPTRFPVGVISGLLGAPYLLFLLISLNLSGGTNK